MSQGEFMLKYSAAVFGVRLDDACGKENILLLAPVCKKALLRRTMVCPCWR